MSASDAKQAPSEADNIATELHQISQRLQELTQDIGLDGQHHNADPADIQALLSATTRLYAAQEADGQAQPLPESMASATETVMLISALMQAQNLNTFDLALWQSKLRRSS